MANCSTLTFFMLQIECRVDLYFNPSDYWIHVMHHLRIVEDAEHFHSHVWRHQDCLVVRSDSVFPQRCVRCGNVTNDETVSKLLFWHTPLLLPVVLVSWPFYLVVALLIRKHMVVQMHLCEQHMVQRRWVSVAGALCIPLALLLGGAALSQSIPSLILAALLLVMLSAVSIGWVRNPIWAIRFESDVALVKNVHPSILEMPSIPEWQPNDAYSVKF